MHDQPSPQNALLKPTATIHLGNKLSLIERKVFNAIIWHSQKNRFTKKADTLSTELMMSLIGLERSKNITVVKEALERLTTTPIMWNTLKKDRTADWGICTFLAGAELSGGQLRYVLNPLLIEKVNNPTLFAKIQLLVQTQFSSKYSLTLYEFLLDEISRTGQKEHHEVQVSLDTLRHVLQFSGSYKHLNSDVLKPCTREINKHADIRVGYQGIKKGRAVAAILFSIERSSVQISMSFDDLHVGQAIESDVTDTLFPNDHLAQVLIDMGISKKKSIKLADTYDEERILGNIAYVEREHQAGKVQNLTAYLVRAIEEDYRPNTKVEINHQGGKSSQERAQQKQQKAAEELRREWSAYRAQRVRERFGALTPEEQEQKRQIFAMELERSRSFLLGRFRKEGFESHLVNVQFYATLSDDLLADPEETSFEAFQKWRAEKHKV
jgi:hypothetical protein